MSISRQTLSVVIVTYKSKNIIDDCINSIDNDIKILIIDNSNSIELKEYVEKKYKNVSCILSKINLGMGSANNLGLKNIKTDYALIINPDVILQKNTINEIIDSSKKIKSFSVIAPISIDKNYPNFKKRIELENKTEENAPFKVKSVDGYAMILNLKRLNNIDCFKNCNFFDENFFMYLENDDFCKRLIKNKENIYIVPNSKIKHLGGRAADSKYQNQIELSRNWHWIWSKFYFNKKHYGFFFAFLNGLPNFFSALVKFILYSLINNRFKKDIYSKRILGFLNALFGKKSSYRPKIDS
tara:strand:+ start:3547 stop:4440 length:894 start_codon:yes stop_codon:yes gene_type:complete